MGRWPDMVLQFAHLIAEDYRQRGHADVQIRVESQVSLNGRQPQPLIDLDADLAKEPRTLWPADWLVPLEQPLKKYQPVRED